MITLHLLPSSCSPPMPSSNFRAGVICPRLWGYLPVMPLLRGIPPLGGGITRRRQVESWRRVVRDVRPDDQFSTMRDKGGRGTGAPIANRQEARRLQIPPHAPMRTGTERDTSAG